MRDYSGMDAALGSVGGDTGARMQRFVDAAWGALSGQGVSWIGFYFKDDGAETMTLGRRRDKPACSPIGLHGVCGRGWREERSIVVRDVRVLGPDYVACDPRDQSEVVVPLFDPAGRCTGVLDVDSFDIGAFDERDAKELARLLVACGLTGERSLGPVVTI